MTNLDLRNAMLDMATRRFYYYCQFRLPQVYTKSRPHLEILCDKLQEFYESDRQRLILNIPPRHGKTLTVELLTAWILGKQPKIGIMTASYNETLSTRFSKFVRGEISEKSVKIEKPSFSDYFPGVKIKDGDGAMQLWALEGSHFSFLATSPGGTMTGIGAQLLIIDDLIKNAEEAFNERILDEHWEWYSNTVLSRLEAGAKQIVIQTRWATKDLSGRLLAANGWQPVIMPAQNPDGSMLCEDILSKAEFEDRKTKTDPVIIAGNYQQAPYDSHDVLYPAFKTYDHELLPKSGFIEAYVDTADEGKDFLAGAVYKVHNNTAYILDIAYTQAPMEQTEGQLAMMLASNKCQTAWIESNNGGKGFARNVERIMREIVNYGACSVRWFHQSENKQARILSNATNVVNSILFPVGWENRWPEFRRDIQSLSRMAKWVNDDAPDMLTGIIEKSISGQRLSVPNSDIRSRARI
jgi:predicted phage terminase large subunit-like protein